MNNKKRIIIGLVVLTVVLIALKINNANPLADNSIGHFERVANMNNGRYGHIATLLKNGNVLIFGGENTSMQAEIYDTKKNKFIKINKSNYSFIKPFAFLMPNNKVLVIDTKSIEIFDPITNLFYKKKKITAKAYKPYKQCIDINNKIFIIQSEKMLSYDINSNTLISLPDFIILRIDATAIPLSNQKILIVGGENSLKRNGKYIPNTEIYDINNNKFLLGPITPNFDGNIKFVILKNNDILILDNYKVVIYKPIENKFYTIGILTKKRNNFESLEAVLLKNGNVLIAGGYDNLHKPILETEIYNPELKKIINGPKLLYPRKYHQLTLLDNGSVLVTGGEENPNPLNLYDVLLNSDIKAQKNVEIYIPPKNS